MTEDFLTFLVQQVPVVVVLGYWIREERAAHSKTTKYYREEIDTKIDDLNTKVDNLVSKFMEWSTLR